MNSKLFNNICFGGIMEQIKYGFYLMESQTDPHSMYGDREMVGPTVTENGFDSEEEAKAEAEKAVNIHEASDTYYDINIYSYDADTSITEEVRNCIIEDAKHTWEPFVVFDYKEFSC